MNPLAQVSYFTDRTADVKTATQAYTCTASVYCNSTRETKEVNLLVKAPSTLALQRLVRKTLGDDWVLMTWNTTCDRF